MKTSKRIFIVLLTIAVMVSSFALFTFAGEAPEITIDSYEYVLAYYEEPIIFGGDFIGGGYADALIMSNDDRVSHSAVTDESAPGGSYVSLAITKSKPWREENVYLNWNSEEGVDDFYLDVTLSAGSLDGNLPKYRLVIDSETLTDVSSGNSTGTSIIALDFKYSQLSYLVLGEDGTPVEALAEYSLSSEAWYNVSVDYSVTGAFCTVTVTNTADAEDYVTLSDVYLPYDLVKNVRLGVHADDKTDVETDGVVDSKSLRSNGNVLKIASISAAGGLNRINTNDPQSAVEDAICAMYDIYNSDDVTIEDKIGLCRVVNSILGYGFVTEKEDVNTAIDDFKLGSITLYADEIADELSTLEALTGYYEKRACVDGILEYADVLAKMDLSPIGEESAALIEADVAKVYTADADLKKAEEDSLAFIELLTGAEEVSLSDDYALLCSYHDAASALEYDITYDGVADVNVYYTAIVESMEDIKTDAEYFISAVNILADNSIDFMRRYNRYLAVKDEIYENETYPGITEALAKYNDVALPDILYNIELAENFINNVNSADYAKYISAKEEYIKKAEESMDICHPDFPGVSAAKALRLEILEYIAEQKKNAQEYVDAVNALDSLSGNELTAAIIVAQNLQVKGNVLGVPGVTEANIKLNQIVSEIELTEKYSEYFISVVESLNYIYKIDDLYSTIIEAKTAELKAKPSYPGVSEASSDLEFAIDSYNAAVDMLNEDFVTANLVAANTVGIGETSNTVADNVIALIQNFFIEEEDESDEEEAE